MSVLSSLLARDQVVTVKKIEEAIQRQVISGGELTTVLLEVGAAPENVVTSYHAASLELPAVARDDVMGASPDAISRIPKELAERHRVVPVAVMGDMLVIAAANALEGEVLDELESAAGLVIDLRISVEARIAAGLQRHYQTHPIPRMRRLLTKLDAVDEGELVDVVLFGATIENRIDRGPLPPQSTKPSAARWARAAAAATAKATAPASVRPAASSVRPAASSVRPAASNARVTTPAANTAQAGQAVRMGGAVSVGGANTRANPAPGAGARQSETRTTSPSVRPATTPSVGPATTPSVGPAASPSVRPAASPSVRPAASPSVRPATTPSVRPAGAVVVSSPIVAVSAPKPASIPPASTSTPAAGAASSSAPPPASALPQGPLDLDAAIRALSDATTRDEIFAVAFAHARTHFDYCALFTVRDDEMEGIEATGDAEHVALIRATSFDLNRPGMLHDVRELGFAKAGSLDVTDADRDVARVLGRTAKQPCAIVPISIRQRLVLVVYGDRAGRALGLGSLGDLLAFGAIVSDALQKLILNRKRGSERALRKGDVLPVPTARDGSSPPAATSRDTAHATQPAAAEPATPEPTQPEATRSRPPAERPQAFDLLGVPRRAPLPPELAPVPTSPGHASLPLPETSLYRSGSVEEEVVLTRRSRSSRPASASSASSAPVQVPAAAAVPVETVKTAPAAPAAAPAPAPPSWAEQDDDDDDGPAIEFSEASEASDSDATIITDMGLDLDDLVDSLLATPREGVPAVVEHLVTFGEPVLRILARRFPGPLYAGVRPSVDGPHPKARDVGPVVHALAAFGKTAVPLVATLLEHKETEPRYFAALVAAEIPSRDLVVRIGRRVLDDEPSVRSAAVVALRAYRRFESEVVEVMTHLRRVGGNDRASLPLRKLAVELLGELRDADAVRMLVQVTGDPDDALASEAHRALVRITKLDLGPSISAWETWLESHGKQHRIEWLIDALLSEDEAMRREAGEELKVLTREFFGFQAGLPRREREVVQRKYRRWWEQIGHEKFAADRD